MCVTPALQKLNRRGQKEEVPACSPFPCDISTAHDREDGVAPAGRPSTPRHPVLGRYRGARLLGPPSLQAGHLPPWARTCPPTLVPSSLQWVSGPGTNSGSNGPSGANIKQDKINAGNSPVLPGGVGRRDREVCTSPVLVQRVRQSLVPALPVAQK